MNSETTKRICLDESLKLAVLYAHISMHQMNSGLPLPPGMKLIREYARERDLEIIRDFVDVKPSRTAFGEMVDFLGSHPEIQIILTNRDYRLHLNMRDYLTIGELGREIHFTDEGCIVSKDDWSLNKIKHAIKSVMEKRYMTFLSEAVRSGQLKKAGEGTWPGIAPIGYLNARLPSGEHGIIPDPARADLVRRCFELCATREYSLDQLLKWARSAGLTHRGSNRPLERKAILRILQNRLYTGSMIWGGKLYAGSHRPIVSMAIWAVVQSLLGAGPENSQL